jgi:hypothetical protein
MALGLTGIEITRHDRLVDAGVTADGRFLNAVRTHPYLSSRIIHLQDVT